MPPKRKSGQKRRRVPVQVGLRERLGRLTLGDAGQAIGGAWEGIGQLTGYNTEVKRFDTSGTIAVANAGSVTNLTAIAEGDDYLNRGGHSLKVLSLEVRGHAIMDLAGPGPAGFDALRLLLFIDTQQQGTAPTPAMVLETVGTTAVTYSPLQHDNTQRFMVLFDETFALTVTGTVIKNFHIAMKLGTHVRFSGTSAADASMNGGQIYALIAGYEVTHPGAIKFTSRVSYVDN